MCLQRDGVTKATRNMDHETTDQAHRRARIRERERERERSENDQDHDRFKQSTSTTAPEQPFERQTSPRPRRRIFNDTHLPLHPRRRAPPSSSSPHHQRHPRRLRPFQVRIVVFLFLFLFVICAARRQIAQRRSSLTRSHARNVQRAAVVEVRPSKLRSRINLRRACIQLIAVCLMSRQKCSHVRPRLVELQWLLQNRRV